MPPDIWFTYEIIAVGKRVMLHVDGKRTADFTYTDPVFGQRLEGCIALAQYGPKSQVHFQKIEIMELPPKANPDANPAVGLTPAPSPAATGIDLIPTARPYPNG